MRPKFLLACPILISLAALPALAQKQSPTERVIAARALYYTPTTAGLHSFGCRVSFDWKDFLTRVSGGPVADDNAFLVYLNSAHMRVSDDLHGAGKLEWSTTVTPPDNLADPAAKLQKGLAEMFDGFFKSWNAYFNGSMVPRPDASVAVTPVGDGVHLHGVAGKMTIDEDFDKNMLLTKAHVLTDEMDVDAIPVFVDTPDGRVISEINSDVRQPITAPPTHVSISVTYQPVAKFRIPELIRYDVKNVVQMDFKLADCTANPEPAPPASTSK